MYTVNCRNPERVRELMIEKLEARRKKYPDTQVVERLPSVRTLPAGTTVGTYTYSCPDGRRFIQAQAAVHPLGRPQSFSEVGFDWIYSKYPRLRCATGQYQFYNASPHAPIFFQRALVDDCIYLDLSSAYWTIVQLVGYDVDWWGGHWFRFGAPVWDYPLSENKRARASIVSSGWSSERAYWNGERVVRKRSAGRNRGLYCLIQHVLNGIAWELSRTVELFYAYTDGYMLHKSQYELAMNVIKSWCMNAKIKDTGFLDLQQINTYRIGNRQTLLYNTGALGEKFSSLHDWEWYPWLKQKLQRALSLRDAQRASLDFDYRLK